MSVIIKGVYRYQTVAVFSERGCWCTVCGKVFNSFGQENVEALIKQAQEEAGFKW